MALFLIEREFAEAVGAPTGDAIEEVVAYNDEHELRWLFSFLRADAQKSYCVYEAPDAGAIRQQAEDLGFPANVITEVSEVNPDLFGTGRSVTGFPAG